MKKQFTVKLGMPESVSTNEMRKYIIEAVALWCKSFAPDNPMFRFDGDSVTVATKLKTKGPSQRKLLKWAASRCCENPKEESLGKEKVAWGEKRHYYRSTPCGKCIPCRAVLALGKKPLEPIEWSTL